MKRDKNHSDFTIRLSVGLIEVVQEPFAGLATSGETLIIDAYKRPDRQRGWSKRKNELDSWVHETIHKSRPDLSEAEVAKLARDITRVMWRAGYRRLPNRPPQAKVLRRAAKR